MVYDAAEPSGSVSAVDSMVRPVRSSVRVSALAVLSRRSRICRVTGSVSEFS